MRRFFVKHNLNTNILKFKSTFSLTFFYYFFHVYLIVLMNYYQDIIYKNNYLSNKKNVISMLLYIFHLLQLFHN